MRISENKFEVAFNEIFDSGHDVEEFTNRDKNVIMIVSLPIFRFVHIMTGNDDSCEYEVCRLFCDHFYMMQKL